MIECYLIHSPISHYLFVFLVKIHEAITPVKLAKILNNMDAQHDEAARAVICLHAYTLIALEMFILAVTHECYFTISVLKNANKNFMYMICTTGLFLTAKV